LRCCVGFDRVGSAIVSVGAYEPGNGRGIRLHRWRVNTDIAGLAAWETGGNRRLSVGAQPLSGGSLSASRCLTSARRRASPSPFPIGDMNYPGPRLRLKHLQSAEIRPSRFPETELPAPPGPPGSTRGTGPRAARFPKGRAASRDLRRPRHSRLAHPPGLWLPARAAAHAVPVRCIGFAQGVVLNGTPVVVDAAPQNMRSWLPSGCARPLVAGSAFKALHDSASTTRLVRPRLRNE